MTALRTDFDTPQPGRFSRSAAGVGLAFKRALVSQCHPTMLFAVLLPFLIALVGALLLLWLFWTPLTDWLRMEASHWDFVNRTDEWLVAMGLFSLKIYLAPVVAAAILLPVSGILGLAIAAVFVMPLVLRHVGHREYAGLALQGRHSTAVSVWNAVGVGRPRRRLVADAAAVAGAAHGLDPAGFWWAFAFSRMMRVDAIVEHASPAERRLLIQRHNGGFWVIGLICSLLNLLPPAWIILPVFSALVNAHYGLEALKRLREERVIDV